MIPLTPRLRAFGKSRTDFTDVTIYNVLKDVLKDGILHREGGRKDGRWVISGTKS